MADLKEIASRVKQEHAARALQGTDEAESRPLRDESVIETEGEPEPEKSFDPTNGAGLAGKMNQMVAEEAKQDDDEKDEFDVEEPESVVDPDDDIDDDDDDEGFEMVIPDAPDPEETDSLLVQDIFEISDEEIQESFEDIPPEDGVMLYNMIRTKVLNYRKDQIILRGMSPDVASEKAIKYMKEICDEENIRYLKDHPNLCVVSVNKENEKDVKFTEEEREKMAKAKVIKFEVVESEELPVAKIRKIDKKNKLAAIQSMDRYMSQYSVPLPILNDYVTFKGTQLVEINNLHVDEHTDILEITEKKANLIYRQLVGGANIQKFDQEKGKLSYKDFLDIFPFNDMDLAIYGIMVATSMEEMEVDIKCDDCGQPYTYKYNLKTLLTTRGLSVDFKDRFEEILKNRSNTAHLQKMYEKNSRTHVVKSPITHNIYHINQPSIARAIRLYQVLDLESQVDVYYFLIYQFIDKILVYDETQDDHIEIDETEMEEMFTLIKSLPQTEINLIANYIAPMTYEPDFRVRSKCEHCGYKMNDRIMMNDLVFLTTRGTPTEIRVS